MATTPATALAGTAVTVTLSAVAGAYHQVHNISWSYSAMPTGGRITVTDGGTTVVDFDLVQDPFDSLPTSLLPILSVAQNTDMVITLAAGGIGVTGKLVIDADDVTFQ